MGNVIDWDGGQRVSMNPGDTATCKALSSGQLYAVFLYNTTQADKDISVLITTDNSIEPVPVRVPGTTADQGLASLVLVSGTDTTSVAVAVSTTAGGTIDCWLGSVSMPTDTSGLNNQQLATNGQAQSFAKYCRYFCVPPTSWHQLTLQSNIQQFISVQFQENFATIYVVNPTVKPPLVYALGSVKVDTDYVITKPKAGSPPQYLQTFIEGDGTQWVWMNADSEQDSSQATIALQALTMLEVNPTKRQRSREERRRSA